MTAAAYTPRMHPLWWALVGFAIGVISMLPLVRLLLRRAESRAREAERRAREAERLAELGAMTGGLAHEIKNPLSTVGLNAQLLVEAIAESDLPEDDQRRLIGRVDALKREIERLRDILTDFLQFAGRIQLEPERKDIVQLCEEVCDFFLPQCEQSRVLLRTRLPEEPVYADVDEGLLKQAVLNLLINAVQAMTRDGEPEHPAELIASVDQSGGEVHIHVIDTGPGIEPDRLHRIFHPYVSGRRGGTGLGLPIARRIVEEHGGRLEVETEPGRGSDFCIEIPAVREVSHDR